MAYSKTPQESTHKVSRLTIKDTSLPTSYADERYGSRYVNCQPIKISQYGSDPERFVIPRPGFFYSHSLPVGVSPVLRPIRGFFGDLLDGSAVPTNLKYMVIGNLVYQDLVLNLASVSIGTTQYTTGYVGITRYTVGTTTSILFLENHATAAYLHKYEAGVFTSVALGFGAAGDPVFLNGYIFINSHPYSSSGVSQRIYNSAINNPTTFSPSTDFIDAELHTDSILFMAKHKNHLVVFGSSSIEFFYDGANQLGSPLTRQPSYTIRIGSITTVEDGSYYRPCYTLLGDDIYFVGAPVGGSIGLYTIQDFQIKKISDHVLDRILNDDINDVVEGPRGSTKLFTTPFRGNNCLLIQYNAGRFLGLGSGEVAGTTANKASHHWCYNPNENEWHEWVWNDGGNENTFYIQEVTATAGNTYYYVHKKTPLGVSTYEAWVSLGYEKTATVDIQVQSEVRFKPTDFGAQQYKHIKYVDILGEFGETNVLSLEYSTEQSLVTYNSTSGLVNNTKGPRRARNLTRARTLGLKLKVLGDSPYSFHGFDVAYNLGST